MNTVLKSLIMLFFVLSLCAVAVFLVTISLKCLKNKRICRGIILFVVVSIILCLAVPLFYYTWPFDIHVKYELVGDYRMVDEREVRPGEEWYCVYRIGGNSTVWREYTNDVIDQSVWGPPTYPIEGSLPDYDFSQYSYVFSFGYQIEEISYTVWDSYADFPFNFGFAEKLCRASLSESYYERTMFVYRLPRQAIQNIDITRFGRYGDDVIY